MTTIIKNKQCQVKLFLLFLIFISTNTIIVKAQCEPETYSLNCIDKIRDGFLYLKSYNIDGQNGSRSKIEYTAVFSTDTKYHMKICTESNNADGIILTIYNSDRDPVISNITASELMPEVEFECELTGIYYLTFTFQDSRRSCGGCVLTFKK